VKTLRDLALIVVGTLLALELLAFGALVSRTAAADDVSLAQAISARVRQHPWLDRRVRAPKRDGGYVFVPTTQHAFRANSRWEGLRIGRHGFVLNGDAEPADFPEKPPDLVRIVLLGGSSLAGATASGNDKTIAAQLERLLGESAGGALPGEPAGGALPAESGGARFQVLNFGMGGNYSYGELMRLVSEVAYLEPDAVILFDGFNDAHYASFEHLRSGLPAPLVNWADYSYQYFDAMAGLRGALRPAPPVMTWSYLLVAELLGRGRAESVRAQREALYAELPARALSDRVTARDPFWRSVLGTNLEFAAGWAAHRGVWLFAYLQPHPWEYKDTACERAAGNTMMLEALRPLVSEARYVEAMRAAFGAYGELYRDLARAFADSPRIRFFDLRPLFEHVTDCIYNDSIHYNDDGNLRIAERMHADLVAAGLVTPVARAAPELASARAGAR
jgi:hypothetical protein